MPVLITKTIPVNAPPFEGHVTDHALSPREVQSFFNQLGWLLALSNNLDSRCYVQLLTRGDFSRAQSVLEIGAGNGYFANLLLTNALPNHARCTLTEVAEQLASTLRTKFRKYGDRVTVQLVSTSLHQQFEDGSFDRIASSYVFDMMNTDQLSTMAIETHRLLVKNGLLCLLMTGPGFTPISRIIMRIHSLLHRIEPRLVGISRPIEILPFFHHEKWEVLSVDQISSCGFPSKIIILKKLG